MSSPRHIQPVTDPAKVKEAVSLIEDVVDKPWHINMEWLARYRWTAVPVESASHFDERDAKLLSQAAASGGCYECLAVATEPLENTILCYKVRAAKEGFLEFSHETTALNYVLLPEDRSFAVLCTSEDYYIVAGPRDFVTKAVGSSIETVREKFMQFATDQFWPEAERKNFIAVAERYALCNGWAESNLTGC